MKLFSAFRKPGWQSSDAGIRADAVANDQDPDLLANLPGLALEDSDARVRRQALRRCADTALYARAMRSDPDRQIQAWARQQWLAAVSAGTGDAPDPARLDKADLEELAVSASTPDLRRKFLEHIHRPGFLAERAVHEPDPGLRQALITRIDDAELLDRIARQLRRKDKRLFRLAGERAQALRLASGDPQARQDQGQALCGQLEQLMRTPMDSADKARQLAQCHQDWSQLQPDELPQALQVRFQGLVDVIQAQLQPAPQPALADVIDDSDAQPGDSARADAGPAAPSPEEIAAQVQLEATLARNAAEIAREKALAAQREREERERRQQQAKLLEELAHHLDAGDLATARGQIAQLEPATLTGATLRQWQSLQPRLRELQGWESWANNKVRARLCDQVEQLIGSGLHPDAISHRITEVREQWRQLDQQEGRDNDSPPTGLDRRLRAACARALKPAREFFDKRQTLRNALSQTVLAFLQEGQRQLGLQAADPDQDAPPAGRADAGTDAGAGADIEAATGDNTGTGKDGDPVEQLMVLQKTAITHLRNLEPLAPHQRKRLAARLRDLLDKIKPRLEAAFADVEDARKALIDAAGELIKESDGRQLARQARQLQARWQSIGKGRRSRDQQQWRQFRAAIDQAFARIDQQRAEHKAELDQRKQEAATLVDELERLAGLTGDDLQASAAPVRELRERWQALAAADRSLAERYDNALTRHRLALQDQARDRRRQQLYRLLDTDGHAGPAQADALALAQALVFEAEALCDILAPEDQREARRRWQMERLQARMSGELADDQEDRTAQVERLLGQWSGLSASLPDGDRQALSDRLRLVIDSL